MSTVHDPLAARRRHRCRCGHTRAVHHHDALGCLARTTRTRTGVRICNCANFKRETDQETEDDR